MTTAADVLLEDILPKDLYRPGMVLDKNGLTGLMKELIDKHPDKYREVTHRLNKIGALEAYRRGGFSFSVQHMRPPTQVKQAYQKLYDELNRTIDDPKLSEEERRARIVELTSSRRPELEKLVFDESLKAGNPLALQIASGVRGKLANLASLMTSDLLYEGHNGKPLGIPIMRSYSQGLMPSEYWAGAYGARKGVLATKLATQQAGYYGKQLNQMSHRLLVTAEDDDNDDPNAGQDRGLPVDVEDVDNEGALLARATAGLPRNTPLTPKVLNYLKRKGVKRLLVRSPMVGGAPDGGLYGRDVGVRELGGIPTAGTNVGMIAAQALSEPALQGQLDAKHSGGIAGAAKAVSGFDRIKSMIEVPKAFPDGATHSQVDGFVESIRPNPAGGHYVRIGGQDHYVAQNQNLLVKPGQTVEAGDELSDGFPSPAELVAHKGIGEARRRYAYLMKNAYKGASLGAHRRNLELLARAMINHVELSSEMGDYVAGDVVPYQSIERTYQPRQDARTGAPKSAVNQYLERPVLHYTIGTKLRPSVLKDLEEFGVQEVVTHPEPPPFTPTLVRSADNLGHDPDWMTKMYGSQLKRNLLEDARRGATSDIRGTSFVPGLSRAVDFGHEGPIKAPAPVKKLPEPELPKTARTTIGRLLAMKADARMETVRRDPQ